MTNTTERLFVSFGDASWGDANTLIITGVHSEEDLNDLIHGSDHEIQDLALDMLNDGLGVRITTIIEVLIQARKQEGDWRGALDTVLEILDPLIV